MIKINLLRISPDSKYLEIDIECPYSYKFSNLSIKKYDYIKLNEEDNGLRDYSYLLTKESSREILRISTLALSQGLNTTLNPNLISTMFYIQLEATFDISFNQSINYLLDEDENILLMENDESSITEDSYYIRTWNNSTNYNINEVVTFENNYFLSLINNNNYVTCNTLYWKKLPLILDELGVCSDVNNVYTLLKDNILNLNANCISPNDYQMLLRNYMFLYAHLEAMRLERFNDAEMYYDLIKKSFKYCNTNRSVNKIVLNSCNCR